jgi:hypothetical protein
MSLLVAGAIAWIGTLDPSADEPMIVEVGPHHRVWQTVKIAPDERGEMVQSESSYTEIATGLNWWNLKTETWEETVEAFEILPQGYAVARRGPHKVIIAGNINEGGAVDIELPDGRRMLSNPMGLSYFDASTGRSVLLAEVKDCVGELIEPNVILFADAFDTIKAALSYTYRRGQFEQDVVIYQDPGPPEDWGLSGATTMLEIYSEVFEAPEPRVLIEGGEVDSESPDPTLDFGSMRMERGTAFFLHRQMEDVPMRKLWHQIEGRQFLIERIPYRDVEPLLRQLDARADRPSSSWLAGRTSGSREGIARLLPPRRAGLELAAIARSHAPLEPGVVLDYLSLLSTQTNQVFRGDETYYCSGLVNLYGTTVIEGGTCVKYANTNSAELRFNGSVQFQTSAYRPAVFTARDDDSVGQTISGSSGNPTGTYAPYALRFYALSSPAIIEHLRVAYAGHGMVLYAPSGHVVRHAQFVNCGTPIGATGNSFTVQNALLHNAAANGFNLLSGAAATGEHLTLHQVARVVNAASVLALTNSLLVGVTNWTYSFTGANNATNSSSAVFQPVGAGHHYLASGSTNRNVGTTNVTSALLTALRKMTTYPPVVLSNTVVTSSVLSPQAARDTDLPDLGYHYAPIDWAVNTLTVTNAGTVVLTNGVVLGTFGDTGIWLRDGSQLVGEGTPGQRNGIVRYNTVQEQATNWGNGSVGGNAAVNPYNQGGPPSVQLRLTDFATLAGGGYHLYAAEFGGWSISNLVVRDCEFSGGSLVLGGPSASSVSLMNNLCERVALNLSGNGSVACYNNLFRGEVIELDRVTAVNPWTIRDNVFESPDTLFSWGHNPTLGYNAYINTTNRFYPTNLTDKVLGSFTYAAGPLGRYYQVTTNLIRAGSRTAPEAGLFHFTVTTNQAKAGTNTVSIGYHYAAVDAQGRPLDTDGDSLPDYLEDRNGNGSVNTGETDWETSENGTKLTPGLQVFNLVE